MSTPDIPSQPERQAAKLPDAGAKVETNDKSKWRRAMLAGLITSPQGVLGAPATAKPSLG